MSQIKYVKGDATAPVGKGRKIIVHCCNNYGLWGAGFVLALSKKWKGPESQYRDWATGSGYPFKLGETQCVVVSTDIMVINMIGQDGVGFRDGKPPIRYKALRTCFEKVAEVAKRDNASVHMPRVGCGLAGGKWDKVAPIIQETLIAEGVPVTVYDY